MMGPLGDPVPSQVEWKCITPLIPHSILRPIGWRHRPGQSDLPEVDPKLVTCEEVVPRGVIHSHAEEIPSQSIPTELIGATVLESHTYPVSSNLIGRESRGRSEEHTSELQSRGHLVCRLLLEKKKETLP